MWLLCLCGREWASVDYMVWTYTADREVCADRQAGQTDRKEQTNWETDRQAGRKEQTDRQADRRTDRSRRHRHGLGLSEGLGLAERTGANRSGRYRRGGRRHGNPCMALSPFTVTLSISPELFVFMQWSPVRLLFERIAEKRRGGPWQLLVSELLFIPANVRKCS